MPISLVVGLDNPMASQLTCRELNRHHAHFRVLGCAHTSKQLLQQVCEYQPNVTLLSSDLQGEATGGLRALRELRVSGSRTRPIVLGDWSDPQAVISVFVAGARGVVCKCEPISVLCKCIRSVHAGQIWANSSQLGWILEALAAKGPIRIVDAKGVPLLTQREEEIVRMVAEGIPNSEISSNLAISPHTVRNHLCRVYEKLGVSNRVELVLYSLSSREKG